VLDAAASQSLQLHQLAVAGFPMIWHHLCADTAMVEAAQQELSNRLSNSEWIASLLSQMRANRWSSDENVRQTVGGFADLVSMMVKTGFSLAAKEAHEKFSSSSARFFRTLFRAELPAADVELLLQQVMLSGVEGIKEHSANCVAAEVLGALCRANRVELDPSAMLPRLVATIEAAPSSDQSLSVWIAAISYGTRGRRSRGDVRWLCDGIGAMLLASINNSAAQRKWLVLYNIVVKHQIVYGCKYNTKAALSIAEALMNGVSSAIRKSAGELLVHVMAAHFINQDVATLPHTAFVALQAKVVAASDDGAEETLWRPLLEADLTMIRLFAQRHSTCFGMHVQTGLLTSTHSL